jgi:hypothetical protein
MILAFILPLFVMGLFGSGDEAKEININLYKEEMLEGFKNMDELFDMTKDFYNDPDMADIFLEAHFNGVDFPDLERGIRIKVDEKTYAERSKAYQAIRAKKYLLSSTTVLFTKYGKLDEYPTGGFLSKQDYNRDTREFVKTWESTDLWSKYRWRVAGNRHSSSMIIMDGSIRLEMPRPDARNLTGDHLLLRAKKATFMAVFSIKEKGRDYLLIEPLRYMIVWRKKGKVYSNFEGPFDGSKNPAQQTRDDEDEDD